ncbi:MAG: type I secretion C-terminal target domain-containing protein, partial [Devosia sp.]
ARIVLTDAKVGDVLSAVSGSSITAVVGPLAAGQIIVTLTGAASFTAYQGAIKGVTFASTSDDPDTSRTIHVTVNDGEADSNVAVTTIEITPVNDPVDVVNDKVITNVTDFSAIQIPNAALLWNDVDADSELTINAVSNPVGGTVANGVVFDPASLPPVVKIYTFAGVTQNTNNHTAHYFEVDPPGQVAATLSHLNGQGVGSNDAVEASNDNYEWLELSDGDRWNTNTPNGSSDDRDHAVFRAQFSIAEAASSITRLDLKVEGHQDDPGTGDTAQFGIWNHHEQRWDLLASARHDDVDGNWVGAITSNVSHYVDGSQKVTIALVNSDNNKGFDIDYVEVKVTSSPSFGTGSFTYTATDGATLDSASVAITGVAGNTISGTGVDEILVGGDGDDILFGMGGNDVLVGGKGNNTLTGGAGADLFILDVDKLGANLKDMIADYDFAEGDAIDLSALLNGAATTGTVGQYVDVDAAGNVRIDTTGNVSATSDIVATVTGASTGETIRFVLDDDGNAADFLI